MPTFRKMDWWKERFDCTTFTTISNFFQKQAKLILSKKINYHSQTGGMFAWMEFKGTDTQLLFQQAKKILSRVYM